MAYDDEDYDDYDSDLSEYDDYEDPDEGDPDFGDYGDDENGKESSEDEDDEEDGEDDDDEGDEEEEDTQKKIQKIKRRAASKKYVEKTVVSAKTRVVPILKKEEIDRLKSIEKTNPEMKADIYTRIYVPIARRLSAFIQKIGSILGPALPFIGIALLIIVAIFAVAIIFDLAVSGLTGRDSNDAQFGVTGADFYGCRVMYVDNEQAGKDIIESYIELVGLSVEAIENDNPNITVNVEMFEDEFSYDDFTEEFFNAGYTTLYNIVGEIATYMYNSSAEDSVEVPLQLMEKLAGIKYFGFSTTEFEDVRDIIIDYINDNDLYIKAQDYDESESAIESGIESAIISVFSDNEHMSMRAEKVYIKDHIFESDDAMMTNITQQNYISMIFMPKKNVTFTYISFLLGLIDYGNFNLYVQLGNDTINITSTQWSSVDDAGHDIWLYESSSSLNVDVGIFSAIDTNDLNYLSTTKSLWQLMLEDRYNIYVQTITAEDGELVVTSETNDNNYLLVNFESDKDFNFVEYETKTE